MSDPICGITVDDLRPHLETDLADPVLALLLQDACDAITARIGPEGEQTVTIRVFSQDTFLILPREVASADDISSVLVRATPESLISFGFAISELALTSDDWRLISNKRLERIIAGTNPVPTFWGWNFVGLGGNAEFETLVTYTPKPETRRIRVMIDLVKLAISYNALKDERAGDYSSTSSDYQEERKKLISELVPLLGFA